MQVTFLTRVYGSPGNFNRGETADLDADWAAYYVSTGWAIEGTPGPKGLPDDPNPVPEGSHAAAPAAPGPPAPPKVEGKGKAAAAAKPAPHATRKE